MKLMKHPRASVRMLFGLLVVCAICARAEKIEKIAVVADSQESNYIQESLADRVYHLIRTAAGQELSDKVLADDIKVLMQSGSFDDVKVERVSLGGDRVGINFIVKPKPVVTNITITGNAIYKTKKLKKLLTLEVNKTLNERKLAESRKAILEKYQNAGYYGTEVNTTEERNAAGTGVNVVFTVKEKSRSKLKGVSFVGNTVFTEDQLKSAIVTKRQWWRYIFRFGNYYNEYQHDLDKEALQKLYQNKGYLDFQVTDIIENKLEDGKWIALTYKVKEGLPYKVKSITMTGATAFTPEKLFSRTGLKVGDYYNAALEATDTDIMKSYYEEKGYLDLRLYPTHKIDADNHEVDIEYRVNEGNICKIRDLVITGNEYTQDKVIRREMAIFSEDLGDNSKIRASRNRLMNLGYFSRVDIIPSVTETPDLRDLRIEVEEKPTGNLSVGAGFSTEDSAIAFLEFSEANFDLSKVLGLEWPPKGAGQRFRSRLQVGSEVSSAVISLTEPWFLDKRLELHTEIFLNNRFEDAYDQRSVGASSMLSWPIAFVVPFTEHKEYWRMGVGVRVEYIKISHLDNDEDDFEMLDDDWLERWYRNSGTVRGHNIFDDKGTAWANRLIWRLTRDTRNAFRFPNRGSILTLQLEYVTEALGSYESYGKVELSGAKYMPVFSDVVLKTGFNFGSATDDKPGIFDRYFAGGIGSMRGFKRRDVAPVDAFDDPLGGNTFLCGTAELLKPVKDFVYLSTFIDIGNVWWDSFEFDADDLNMSIGVGLQFKAIPLNLYYGYPIRTGYDHLDHKSGRFHFNIGYTF